MEKEISTSAIIKNVAEQTSVNESRVKNVMNAFWKEVESELKKGNVVSLNGIGKFSVIERAEREGVNPQTKEKITIKATKVVKFKASKTMKENVI